MIQDAKKTWEIALVSIKDEPTKIYKQDPFESVHRKDVRWRYLQSKSKPAPAKISASPWVNRFKTMCFVFLIANASDKEKTLLKWKHTSIKPWSSTLDWPCFGTSNKISPTLKNPIIPRQRTLLWSKNPEASWLEIEAFSAPPWWQMWRLEEFFVFWSYSSYMWHTKNALLKPHLIKTSGW